MAHPLYTYGYIRGTMQELGALADAGVQVLDIRISPTSRNPAWRQPFMKRVLGAAYHWCPELGNVNYKSRGPIRISDLEAGLDVLGGMLAQSPVVILCACADPRKCHRSTVAEAARERWPGLEVRPVGSGER